MATPYYISPRVIDTVSSLPEADRRAITAALGNEFMLGGDPYPGLNPVQAMLYAMIRHYVEQDTERQRRLVEDASGAEHSSFQAIGA